MQDLGEERRAALGGSQRPVLRQRRCVVASVGAPERLRPLGQVARAQRPIDLLRLEVVREAPILQAGAAQPE